MMLAIAYHTAIYLLYVLTWTVPRHVTQTQYSAVCIQWKLSAVIHSGKNWALGLLICLRICRHKQEHFGDVEFLALSLLHVYY